MASMASALATAAGGPSRRALLRVTSSGGGRRQLATTTSSHTTTTTPAASSSAAACAAAPATGTHRVGATLRCLHPQIASRGLSRHAVRPLWLAVPSSSSSSLHQHQYMRALSTKAGEEQQQQQQEGEDTKDKEGQEQQEGQEDPEPEYPQEKIGFFKGLAYFTVFGIAVGSLYFIVDELMPSRMSANYLFNEAFDAVKANHEVLNRYGEPLKGYGRDGGGRREGRRNFVEHKNYTADDETKRLRIRFNIEGPFGMAFVFAEVTSDMPKGQWMYLLVHDQQTGRVHTIEDNRAMHAALAEARSPEERAALEALIQSGGGGGGSQH